MKVTVIEVDNNIIGINERLEYIENEIKKVIINNQQQVIHNVSPAVLIIQEFLFSRALITLKA